MIVKGFPFGSKFALDTRYENFEPFHANYLESKDIENMLTHFYLPRYRRINQTRLVLLQLLNFLLFEGKWRW